MVLHVYLIYQIAAHLKRVIVGLMAHHAVVGHHREPLLVAQHVPGRRNLKGLTSFGWRLLFILQRQRLLFKLDEGGHLFRRLLAVLVLLGLQIPVELVVVGYPLSLRQLAEHLDQELIVWLGLELQGSYVAE